MRPAKLGVIARDAFERIAIPIVVPPLQFEEGDRIARALDKGDGATYASTYTVDGQFGSGANATKGREALSKLVVRQPAAGEPARAPLYHMELNHWIEFVDKDHARYHAYYLTVSGALGRETPPRIVAAGQSLDEMERVSGKWLVAAQDA